MNKEQEFAWLRILNSLYELRVKYPDDEFINKSASSIAFDIGENINTPSPVDGFVELAELPYVDAIDLKIKYQDHYQQVLQTSLLRLSKLDDE